MSDKYQGKPGKSAESDTTESLDVAASEFVSFSFANADPINANPAYDLPSPFTPQFGLTVLTPKSSPELKQRESKDYLNSSATNFTLINQEREEQAVTPSLIIIKPEEYSSLPVTIMPQESTVWLKPDPKECIKAPPPTKTKPVLPSKMQVILKPYEGEVETAVESIDANDSRPAEIVKEEEESKEVLIWMPWVYSIETILAVGQLHASNQRTIAIDKEANIVRQVFKLKVARGNGKKKIANWEEVAPSPTRRANTYEEQTMFKEKAKRHTERRLAEVGKDERLKRKVKITLNKLVSANFDKLKVEILETIIHGQHLMQELVKLIFVKAWSELMYTSMYAELCNFINQEYGYFEVGPESSRSKRNNNAFRKNLLTMSQNIFESKIDLTKDSKEQQAKLTKKILGNIRFIGELFKVKILSSKIILACIFELLQEDEDKLEGAIILLKTCGNKLEESIVIEQTERAMERLDFLKSRVSIRLWIMIRKLENLRRNRWAEESDVPKPVEEVRKKHRRGQQRA